MPERTTGDDGPSVLELLEARSRRMADELTAASNALLERSMRTMPQVPRPPDEPVSTESSIEQSENAYVSTRFGVTPVDAPPDAPRPYSAWHNMEEVRVAWDPAPAPEPPPYFPPGIDPVEELVEREVSTSDRQNRRRYRSALEEAYGSIGGGRPISGGRVNPTPVDINSDAEVALPRYEALRTLEVECPQCHRSTLVLGTALIQGTRWRCTGCGLGLRAKITVGVEGINRRWR